MLRSLHISNYALISGVDIEFYPGFNVITGETGAGKSIILGALSLILGGRADTRVVTDPSAKTVIEAQFDITGYDALKQYCIDSDIEWDDNTCILRREIAPAGRSRAFVNDSPVPVAKLREVAMFLVDIHSQHQNQLLSTPEFQLRVIDTLAGNGRKLTEYTARYNAYRDAVKKLRAARAEVERSRQDEEYTRFQLEQIEALGLVEGEQERLEHDREVLENMSNIKASLAAAIAALNGNDGSALELIDSAAAECRRLEGVLDRTDDIPARLESVSIEVADVSRTLESLDESLEGDGGSLEAIEDRLNSIYSLCHRHHVASGDELIAMRDTLRARLDNLDNSEEFLHELERKARRLRALARETAQELSESRRREAERFARQLREAAMPLGMKNLQVQVSVEQVDMNATGIDEVKFLTAFNKNQPLMPVGNGASGGEISRLMLSVKSIIASKMQLPSIIFDEIDTGVSGEVADSMGRMMLRIAETIQVITITHLPQVAAKASHHYKVYKEDAADRTLTHISLLDTDERVAAIATMLSGNSVDEAAMNNARSLLTNVNPNLFNGTV
ncbi:MAG: DNA repair protein RecN [Barnesiella sp.]|nr:DNA repair protein RecN [Barnesiella sp.]